MASSGQLIDAVSLALGIPQPTVFAHDRNLSEAGLRTKSGRGRSAARMTGLDAARLVISIMSSPISGPSVAGSVEAYAAYAGLISGDAGSIVPRPRSREEIIGSCWELRGLRLPDLQHLAAHHSAEATIAGLLESIRNGSFGSALGMSDEQLARWNGGVSISFSAPIPFVRIRLRLPMENETAVWDAEEHNYFFGGSVEAQADESQRRFEAGDRRWNGGMRQERWIGFSTLYAIAACLREGVSDAR